MPSPVPTARPESASLTVEAAVKYFKEHVHHVHVSRQEIEFFFRQCRKTNDVRFEASLRDRLRVSFPELAQYLPPAKG